VLRQIRLAQPQTVLEMADAGLAAVHQGFDDLQADRVPQRLEDAGALAKAVFSVVFHIPFLEYGDRRPPDSDRCHPANRPIREDCQCPTTSARPKRKARAANCPPGLNL